jgi:hypothetical protein
MHYYSVYLNKKRTVKVQIEQLNNSGLYLDWPDSEVKFT